MSDIGSRIKEIRVAESVKAASINRKLGRSRSWINNIESGRNEISAQDLKAVAQVMGKPIQEFYSSEPYRTIDQRIIERILAYCAKENIDPESLNAAIGKPNGWLQRVPRDIKISQLAKVSSILGYPIDAFALGL